MTLSLCTQPLKVLTKKIPNVLPFVMPSPYNYVSFSNQLATSAIVKACSEAFAVYNMLKYSKRTMCKSLHERILHTLLAGQLLKDAYVVVKDNATFISRPATKKFVSEFMKSGNINLINDVLKTLHDCGYKLDQAYTILPFVQIPTAKLP
ncbi:Pentatricopeptide repeat-containing protein [Spatholobus suberectus]|nr:Pentatricopeptide repeat-containing protein [Spatholobus suberectus]